MSQGLGIAAAFAAYREAVTNWARQKPASTVASKMLKLQDQAKNGSSLAALEIAIIDAALETTT
jgi:hypothetical protein